MILIYLTGMVVFSMFRVVETFVYCWQNNSGLNFGGLYPKSLLIGLRFDTVVSCFMLAPALLMIAVGQMARITTRGYYKAIHLLLMSLYTLCFLCCAADIPYFCFFFTRFDAAAFELADGFAATASMILGEPKFAAFILVFLAVAVGWWLLGRIIYRRALLPALEERLPVGWSIGETVLLAVLCFAGMRGKVFDKLPIRVSTAYYCENPFLNQLGLNPVFTLMKSIGHTNNERLNLMDGTEALNELKMLRITTEDSTLNNAGLRLPDGTNVVIIIMESMTANKTGLVDPTKSLTPCLDSLMKRSMTFTNAYSAGIHTHNGIYSTLYGHPALLSRKLTKELHVTKVEGLPQKLSAVGYSTSFFITHDIDYDNLRSFLYSNGFGQVHGQQSYPISERVGTWGVPDHIMLDHMLQHIDSIADHGPFLACAMTCSDHAPFVFPEGIDLIPKNKEMNKRIVEYADWSIGRFIRAAEKKQWGKNTLFVLVADHGQAIDRIYDMSLAYNHIPILFYAPGRIEPEEVHRMALQIDVAPTVLDLIGVDDGGTMVGMSLLSHIRDYAFFSADDKIGVVDDTLFWLYRVNQQRASLYRYREWSTDDIIESEPTKAETMRRHAFSMIQASQEMIEGNDKLTE